MNKWCCFFALTLTSCSDNPAWYPLPFQRDRLETRPATFIQMSDPAADQFITGGIANSEGSWRWTGKRPELRFPPSPAQAKVVVEFAIAAQTFETTGPLTLAFIVNGKPVDRVRYPQPGNYRFEKPVTLNTDAPNTLAIDVDKVWTSPTDGNQLGIILSAAGFLP